MNRIFPSFVSCVCLFALLVLSPMAGASQTVLPNLSFAVVSIKPSPPGTRLRGVLGPQGDRFTMPGATLRMLLQYAYGLEAGRPLHFNNLILAAPSWVDSDRFDVEAKANCSDGPISQEQLTRMLQSLLATRFHLRAHFETRHLPTFDLLVAKDGLKMQSSLDQTPTTPAVAPPVLCATTPRAVPVGAFSLNRNAPLPRGSMVATGSPAGTTIQGAAIPMLLLINTIQQHARRPVGNKTNLDGLFDFKLQFVPQALSTEPSPASDAYPSLGTALQEQLGLRLEPSEGPIDVLVIDSIQKPTEN